MKKPPVTFQKVCINLHELNLSAVEFTCLAVISIIIGTLIYHLEKNIWSYGIQSIFSSRGNVLCRLFVITVELILLIIPPVFILSNFLSSILDVRKHETLLFVVLLAIIVAISALVVSLACIFRRIVDDTKEMWLAEKGEVVSASTGALNGNASKIIMEKVSTWSDFIHCGQSCAWAWIYGSSLAYLLLQKNTLLTPFYTSGLLAAVLLLIAEALIDWHRWKFVLCAINKESFYKKEPHNLNKQESQKKSENHGCICGCLLTLVIAFFIVIVPVIPLLTLYYLFSNLISPKS